VEQDPVISEEEVSLLLVELSYGLANHPAFEFSYLPRAADEIVDKYFWCRRNAPEDIAQIFGDADVATLPARVRRLSPRGRTELLDAVVRAGGGTRRHPWR